MMALLVGFAATAGAQRVQVDPENIQDYAGLKQVVANINDAPGLKKAYDDATTAYNDKVAIPKPPEKKLVDVSVETKKTSPLVTAINNFATSKKSEQVSEVKTPNELSYRIRVKQDKGGAPVFYLYVTHPDYTSTVDKEMKNQDLNENVQNASKFNKWKDAAWTKTDMSTIRNYYWGDDEIQPYNLRRSEGSTIDAIPSQMYLCYAEYKKINEFTYDSVYVAKPFDPSNTINIECFCQDGWLDRLSVIATNSSQYDLEVTFTETKQVEQDNSAAIEKWQKDIDNAREVMENAETDWLEIKDGNFYLDADGVFKITKNIDYPTTGYQENLEWPANRKLDGGNHMYTGTEKPLLKYNRGEIYNMIAPYTQLVTKNVGDYSFMSDCISKSSEGYVIEKPNGSSSFQILEEAVYQLRDKFGFDVETNRATGPAERTTKLYEAKYFDANHKDLYTFKVNLAETDGVSLCQVYFEGV